ncbi:MAG: KilA-N domain-containing protein [Methylococcales bacterium]|nr:KilA-N domain-containing protein [Methylococcales bacterium]
MNTSITIGTITVHQSENGLYSLNDLHKASGGEKRHSPKFWLLTDQPKEMAAEILKVGIPTFKPIEILKGKYGGTYACKELVYSYAIWINARYALIVIRTFDALTNATTQQELINLKHQVDNAMQADMFNPYQSPRDPACLQVIMCCSSFQAKQYHDELVSKGVLTFKDIDQPPRRVYYAKPSQSSVIGRKGETVLFDASVKRHFPVQTSWVAGGSL